MLCCVVLLALVGFVFRRRCVTDPFPPPARRSVAGDSLPVAPRIPPPPPSGAAIALTILLRWGAIGIVAYVAAVTVLLAAGAAGALETSDLAWFLRDFLFAVLAAAGLLLAGRRRAGRLPARRHRAFALMGAGSAWTVLGIVDMHFFALFEIAHGQMLWAGTFHTAGIWAIAAGLLLLIRPVPSRPGLKPARRMIREGEPA